MNKNSQSFPQEQFLAPYALQSCRTLGRRFDEPLHSFRMPFQRDRDRIIHSRAFRRLEYKTQVFLNSKGDHYRTRMTHTIEVVAIARTLARGLRLNEDLTEAIALAHDLGHTPFGHMGERVLNELIAGSCGGFDHNEQSLRVVDRLEKKYPSMDGLNLTWEVRAGLVKRRGRQVLLDGQALPPQPSLEAQVADLADDVAYYAHDVDDGITSGLLVGQELQRVQFWNLAREAAVAGGGEEEQEYFPAYVVRCLIDMLVGDIIGSSSQRLQELGLNAPEDVVHLARPVIGFSESFSQGSAEFRRFLFENLYWNEAVLEVNRKVGEVVRRLFLFFESRPDRMGRSARQRIDSEGLHRAIADYIAGMTDRFALQIHDEL